MYKNNRDVREGTLFDECEKCNVVGTMDYICYNPRYHRLTCSDCFEKHYEINETCASCGNPFCNKCSLFNWNMYTGEFVCCQCWWDHKHSYEMEDMSKERNKETRTVKKERKIARKKSTD